MAKMSPVVRRLKHLFKEGTDEFPSRHELKVRWSQAEYDEAIELGNVFVDSKTECNISNFKSWAEMCTTLAIRFGITTYDIQCILTDLYYLANWQDSTELLGDSPKLFASILRDSTTFDDFIKKSFNGLAPIPNEGYKPAYLNFFDWMTTALDLGFGNRYTTEDSDQFDCIRAYFEKEAKICKRTSKFTKSRDVIK